HLLKAMTYKREDKAEMMLIAVHPDYQGLGVNALFFADLIPVYNELGYHWAETGPQLEDNVRELSQWKPLNPQIVKRRRCYTKEII
ncbi:MAG: N-acetyltransferase, partial [Prevotella sp.]|nr:N-acetyltransferase [Prevotella sp.]